MPPPLLADEPDAVLRCNGLLEKGFLQGWLAAGLRGDAGAASGLAVVGAGVGVACVSTQGQARP